MFSSSPFHDYRASEFVNHKCYMLLINADLFEDQNCENVGWDGGPVRIRCIKYFFFNLFWRDFGVSVQHLPEGIIQLKTV